MSILPGPPAPDDKEDLDSCSLLLLLARAGSEIRLGHWTSRGQGLGLDIVSPPWKEKRHKCLLYIWENTKLNANFAKYFEIRTDHGEKRPKVGSSPLYRLSCLLSDKVIPFPRDQSSPTLAIWLKVVTDTILDWYLATVLISQDAMYPVWGSKGPYL